MIDSRDRIVIGAPGGLAFWAFNLVQALASFNRPAPMPVVIVERLATVEPLPAGQPGRILMFHCPTNQLLDALEMQDLTVLYLEEPAALVLNYLARTSTLTLLEAARVASASYVARPSLPRIRRLVVLHRNSKDPVSAIVAGIIRYLGLEVPAAAIDALTRPPVENSALAASLDAAIVGYLPAAHRRPLDDPAQAAEAAELVSRILSPVADNPTASSVPAIVWPGSVFLKFAEKQPNERADTDIELLGPARILLHGPYFYLPRGRYVVDFTIACEDVSPDNTFRIEAFAIAQCTARIRYRPPSSGTFTGRFLLPHDNVGAEIQVQTIAERGAIFGRLRLVSFSLRPEPIAGTDPPS